MADTLPNKPSEILEVALRDLEITENNPKYKINMEAWVSRDEGFCSVCHAGAVMINSLKIDTDDYHTFSPTDFNRKTSSKLQFINYVRDGLIDEGLMKLADANVISVKALTESGFADSFLKIPVSVSNYRTGYRNTYKLYIQFMIEYFRSEGL